MSDGSGNHPPVAGQLDAEAAGWCSLMHGPEADRHRPAFEAWLRRGALHRVAYNRMEEVYLVGARLAPRLLTESSNADDPNRSRSGLLAVAAAVSLLGLLAVSIARQIEIGRTEVDVALLGSEARLRLSTMRTSGEAFRLSDGSVVILGPDSEVAVAYDALVRRLHLARGRSRFDVATEGRPFVVDAGGGSVRAGGTSFDVEIGPARRVRVKVISGEVTVRLPIADGAFGNTPTRHLSTGGEIGYGQSSSAQVVPAANAQGWGGQTITVAELVAQANRRSAGGPVLRIADQSVAEIQLGGDFRAHGPAVVAERLAHMLDLELDRGPGQIVLRRRR